MIMVFPAFQKKTTAKEHEKVKGEHCKKCVFLWENGGTWSIQSSPALDIVVVVSFLFHVACPTLQSLWCRAFIISLFVGPNIPGPLI